jgi:hypothetical protein
MKMNNYKSKLFLAALCFTLASCAGERGNKMAEKMYNDQLTINVNQASKDKITVNYQYPDFIWKDKDGNTVYNYQYTKASPTILSYIPLISVLTNRTRINNYDISLTFNKQEKLQDVSFFHETFVY